MFPNLCGVLSVCLAVGCLAESPVRLQFARTPQPVPQMAAQRRGSPPRTAQSKPKVQTPTTPKPNWLQEPFDPSLASLPTGFAGHDVQALCVALQQGTPVKGEFETTAAFDARVQAARANPLIGTVTSESILAFVIPRLTSLYDADSGVLFVKVPLEDPEEATPRSPTRRALFLTETKTSSTYVGTNAFGVASEVTRIRGNLFGLTFDNMDAFTLPLRALNLPWPGLGIGAILGAQMPLDPQTAMNLKPNLALLAVGKLTSRTAFEGRFTHEPTRDSPDDIILLHHMLDIHLMSLWAYDATTGRVYGKIDAKEMP
jgi:hypothetical protein